MNLEQIIDHLKAHENFSENVAATHVVPAKRADFTPINQLLHRSIVEALDEMGIKKLYTHQHRAVELYSQGKSFVVTTPTASGKTLSYLLPILQNKIENPHGRHLFMFPTKALAQDQLALYRNWQGKLQSGWNISTFDGDTPPAERRIAKKAGDFILTNPDMLHSGILPHHTTWKNLFENLQTIVIDEMHTYLGVFGSNVANVLRRLNRIVKHYGADPIYIFSSATIANPVELAHNLAEKEFEHVSESGAPEGEKKFIFYNPPVIDEAGNRQSPYKAAAQVGELLVKNEIPTIFFARSRIRVELLVSLLQSRLPWHLKNKVKGYRGGYLPLERRKIERQLRQGEILAVVSTNALELGIDIGMLRAVVSVGYPGRISSLLQQFGRAGRKKESALAVMVATPSALDQYLMNHPRFVLESGGESAIVNPHNMMIMMQHLKCAAYEMRFKEGDLFGDVPVKDYLDFLVDGRVLVKKEQHYFWADESYPASDISLRSAAQDNFVIVDITMPSQEKVIGEIDYFAAPTHVHTEAIYIHQGVHYYVEELKWEERRAEVKQIKSDYYTDAHQKVQLSIISKDEQRAIDETGPMGQVDLTWGEITVIIKAYLYKKIKIQTSENLGWGEIHTPEIELHTQAAWVEFESGSKAAAAIMGQVLTRIAYIMRNMAPLVALCDRNDISVQGLYKDNQFKECALVFYDRFPGGVGLAYKLMRNLETLLTMAIDTVTACECQGGCPSCIGVWDVESFRNSDNADELIDLFSAVDFKSECLSLMKQLKATQTKTLVEQ